MAIRHKRKETGGYSWQASDLVAGQLGINTVDRTLHLLDAAGRVAQTRFKTRGTTPPSSPVAGEIFEEVDGDGYPVEDWFWHSGNSEWLSVDVKIFGGVGHNGNVANFAGSLPVIFRFPVRLIRAFTHLTVAAAQDGTNFWTLNLGDVTTLSSGAISNGSLVLASVNTSGGFAAGSKLFVDFNVAGLLFTPTNTHFGLRVQGVATGAPGNVGYTIQPRIECRRVRT